jgi:4-alpha-glucanotransferase
MALFNALKTAVPEGKLIAEDLGLLTPQVLQLRKDADLPGMKVLQFAFDSPDSLYLPHNCVENSVCYPGTHDNMTTRQWLQSLPEQTAAYAKAYMLLSEQEGLVWGVIRTAMSTVCKMCIVQLQDYLALGAQARMNCPCSQSPADWSWRVDARCLTDALAQKMRALAARYGRIGKSVELSENGE